MGRFKGLLKEEGMAYLERAGVGKAWAVFSSPEPAKEEPFEERTIRDIVSKLMYYGSASEKQMAFVGRLLTAIEERPAREAARKAEAESALPVPVTEARIVIRGEVLAIKEVVTKFGPAMKMLVKTAEGWKVWGSKTFWCEKGSIVEFTAGVEVSKDDPKFGFFSRPAKGRVVTPKFREIEIEAAA